MSNSIFMSLVTKQCKIIGNFAPQIYRMKTTVWALLALLSLAACKTTPQENSSTETSTAAAIPATLEDSMYKLVIAMHDEAMPKMNQLKGLQKTAQQQIDSLKAIKNKANEMLMIRLEKVKLQLAAAEKGMDDWMAQFEPDPQQPTSEERGAYFKDQYEKAKVMRDNIFISLDSAAAIIR